MLISSSDVSFVKKSTYKELDSAGPLNCYGEAKVFAEKLVTFKARGRGVVIRNMGVCGMDPSGNDFCCKGVRPISVKSIIQVATHQFGSTTFSGDPAEPTSRITEWSSSGAWHVARPEPLLMRYKFTEEICRLGGLYEKYTKDVQTTSLYQKAPKPRYGVLDILKLLSKDLKMRSLEEVWSI